MYNYGSFRLQRTFYGGYSGGRSFFRILEPKSKLCSLICICMYFRNKIPLETHIVLYHKTKLEINNTLQRFINFRFVVSTLFISSV